MTGGASETRDDRQGMNVSLGLVFHTLSRECGDLGLWEGSPLLPALQQPPQEDLPPPGSDRRGAGAGVAGDGNSASVPRLSLQLGGEWFYRPWHWERGAQQSVTVQRTLPQGTAL